MSVDKIRELFWKLLSLCNAPCLAAMWVYLFEVHWCWNFENNKYTKFSVTWNYHGRRIVHLGMHTWVWSALFAMLWDSLQLLHTAIWPNSCVWMLSFSNKCSWCEDFNFTVHFILIVSPSIKSVLDKERIFIPISCFTYDQIRSLHI